MRERIEGRSTFRKALVLGTILILLGVIDWLTTLLGVHYLGAAELNPLFASMVNSNILAYSGIKLAAAVLVGFLFYKGYVIEKAAGISSHLGKVFLETGYLTSLMFLTFVVANNALAIVSLL